LKKHVYCVINTMPLKILIADDNELVRSCMSELFCESGHLVFEADNGARALELLRNEHIDAVLMDLRMPVMNGVEATRALRKQQATRDLPVFAFSATDNIEGFDASLFTRVLPKPMSPSHVLAAVCRHVSQAQSASKQTSRRDE
jgi:CheY-like chemotaxis protein